MKQLAAPLALASLFASCGSQVIAVQEAGVPFNEAFPTYAELIACEDVEEAHERLLEAQRPETEEHHAELLRVARDAESIDVAHLMLLVDAVAIPRAPVYLASDPVIEGFLTATGTNVTITVNGVDMSNARRRGDGEFAHVVDELLLETVGRLSDVDATNAGLLFGRTETNEALAALAEVLLPIVDDGTPAALESIFKGFDREIVRGEFVAVALLPRDALNGEREWIALEYAPHDSVRIEIVKRGLARRETVDVALLARYLDVVAVDSNRLKVLELGLPKLGAPTQADGLAFVEALSVDSNRLKALSMMGDRFEVNTLADAATFTRALSVDSNRKRALLDLAESIPSATAEELREVLSTLSVDSNRLAVARALCDKVTVETSAAFEAVLALLSVDANRLAAVKAYREKLSRFTADEREALASRLTVRSNETAARALLGLE